MFRNNHPKIERKLATQQNIHTSINQVESVIMLFLLLFSLVFFLSFLFIQCLFVFYQYKTFCCYLFFPDDVLYLFWIVTSKMVWLRTHSQLMLSTWICIEIQWIRRENCAFFVMFLKSLLNTRLFECRFFFISFFFLVNFFCIYTWNSELNG